MTPASAVLSPCRLYRYHLQRTWVENAPRLCYVMLNPSTADAIVDDATIRACRARAVAMGMGGIDVVNLFALRATDPRELYDKLFVVSAPDEPLANDWAIEIAVKRAKTVICAWGKHGTLGNRGRGMLDRLREWGITPYALRLNKDGSPGHPLYIPIAQKPFAI